MYSLCQCPVVSSLAHFTPLFFPLPLSDAAKSVYSLEDKWIGLYMVMMSIIGFVFLLLVIFWDTALWKLRAFFNRYIYFGIYKTYQKVSN